MMPGMCGESMRKPWTGRGEAVNLPFTPVIRDGHARWAGDIVCGGRDAIYPGGDDTKMKGDAYRSSTAFPSAVNTLQQCALMCERMLTVASLQPDAAARINQMRLLRDCIDVCALCAQFIARNSPFAKSACQLCAYVCETCGTECLKFPDAESQQCGQMCLQCADACKTMAG